MVTPDLPGEYAPSAHDSHRESSAQIDSGAVNSPELGFVLFGEKTKIWDAFTTLDSLSHFHALPLRHQSALAFSASRAPPCSVFA